MKRDRYRYFIASYPYDILQLNVIQYDTRTHNILWMFGYNTGLAPDYTKFHSIKSNRGLSSFQSDGYKELTRAQYLAHMALLDSMPSVHRASTTMCITPTARLETPNKPIKPPVFKAPSIVPADLTIGEHLPWTIGVEITAIPTVWNEANISKGWNRIVDGYYKLNEYLNTCGYKDSDGLVHTDGHCIEASSPVFTSKEQLVQFYDLCNKWFTANKFKPHHPEVICGGGHIHVGKFSGEVRKALVIELLNRPYISWIFLQPDDTESANNIGFKPKYYDMFKEQSIGGYNLWVDTASLEIVKLQLNSSHEPLLNDKEYAFRLIAEDRIEFRFFEAPKDRWEQLDQLEFILALVQHVSDNYSRDGKLPTALPPRTFAEWQSFSPVPFISEFKSLLRKLDLPYSRYEKYIKRNLLPRWELERERL